MLTRLLVENLTVIDQAELSLGPGLVVVTGETGAGKTILTQAVRLVSGEKADVALVGPRCDEAYAEAEFTDKPPAVLADVADPDSVLILGRRLRRDGPTRALCTGRTCSAEQLQRATEQLISLTGQHAARQLADGSAQLDMLDSAGGLLGARETVSGLFKDWKRAEREVQQLRESLSEGMRRMEMLRHEIGVVRDLDPEEGEVETLSAERDRLAHTDSLRTATALAAELLGGDDANLMDGLGRVSGELEGVADHDDDVRQLLDGIIDASERLNDCARDARALADAYDADPERLNDVESRLSALGDLRRRFGGLSIGDILTQVGASEHELGSLENGDERLTELQSSADAARVAFEQAAAKLSERRRKAGRDLAKRTEGHLHDLGLAGAKLSVELARCDATPRGVDKVTMLLAANKGLEAAPLDKGASGGELARVNLALLLATAPDRGTFIFDEVDAGIGGTTAHVVAAKLKELSAHAQVIVVTHLAQIAVQADQHFALRKSDESGVARTTVVELDSPAARERELARLMGADANDEVAARTAAKLVRAAATPAR